MAAWAVAEVPIVIGAALVASGCSHWRARQEVELGDQRRLAARVDHLRLRPQHPGYGAEFALRSPEATGEAPCLAAAV